MMQDARHNMTLPLDGCWQLQHCPIGQGKPGALGDLPVYDYRVPGDVHEVFIREGIIPDPLCDMNDEACRWLEDEEFWCRRTFRAEPAHLRRHMQLVFDGLDCTADIWLNGVFLGRTENAFVEMLFDVSAIVQAGENTLLVRIDQGLRAVQDKDLRRMGMMWNNAQPYRAWMRKPQYVYGWDWTIWLPSCGIWRGVRLEGWDHAAIRDAFAHTADSSVTEGAPVRMSLQMEADWDGSGAYRIEWAVADASGAPVDSGSLPLSERMHAEACATQARLWWPNGMGDAHLYRVQLRLVDAAGAVLQTVERTLGIRTVSIREEQLNERESGFTFVINGEPVFCKGANVVPEDCLPGRITDAQTRDSVRLAQEAHMNMLRVWGGGVYASEAFLEACDRAGIMVWHDFMFACGYHPDDDADYMRSVTDEAEKAIRRLRCHSCVIGWSGNNEIQEMYAGQKRWNPDLPFYGEGIYTRLLPEKVAALHPGAVYRESSPLGGDDPAGPDTGDQHIWHFTHRPNDPLYLDLWRFTDFRAKFLSEFGLIGCMNLESARRCISPEHLHPDDPVWLHHTNDSAAHQLLNIFVNRYFGDASGLTLQQYILRSQAIQAEITRHIYDEFRARKFECSGLLFWTLGDSLGMHNWSLLDYYRSKRPVYHALRRSMAPVATAVRGYDVQNFAGMAAYRGYFAANPAPLEIWGMNDTRADVPCTLRWQLLTVTGSVICEEERACSLPANRSVCLCQVDVAGRIAVPEETLLYVQLLQNGVPVHENRYFFAPFAKMLCPEANPRCHAEKTGPGQWRVTLESSRFVWMLHLETPQGVETDDNDFDLLPGVPRTVTVFTETEDYTPRFHWLGEREA